MYPTEEFILALSMFHSPILKIPEEEKTPVILQLLGIIEQISVSNLLPAEEIQLLKDEIARLKDQVSDYVNVELSFLISPSR